MSEIKRQGLTIKITNLERTIVDVLDRPDLAGGWEEICRSLDHIVNINLPEIVEYTLLLENATTTAKVGFFLEQLPSYLAVDIKTTEIYARANLEMKRAAIEKVSPAPTPKLPSWKENKSLLKWLQSL